MCSVIATAPGAGCLFTPAGSARTGVGGRGESLLPPRFATESLH